jgi:hypothetical protein
LPLALRHILGVVEIEVLDLGQMLQTLEILVRNRRARAVFSEKVVNLNSRKIRQIWITDHGRPKLPRSGDFFRRRVRRRDLGL